MNKIEANIALFAVMFFAAVQYGFLAGVPADLSQFAFLCITNLVGFFMAFAFFFGELFRLDVIQIKQSAILSLELIGFNLFLMMGAQHIAPVVVSSIVSGYFIFILIFEIIFEHKFPDKFSVISVFTVLTGLFLMMNADMASLFNIYILYILLSDICVAVYVMHIGKFASSSNPAILAMGQMFFCFIFSLILWIGEIFFTDVTFSLPTDRDFWVGVIYISFFVRFFDSIIRIYAQKYISPLNTALINSSGLVITLFVSPMISPLFGLESEKITLFKMIGSIFIILGIMIMEPGFFAAVKSFFAKNVPSRVSKGKEITLIILIAAIYIGLDVPVAMTKFLPSYIGIKNALPFITGLFFGFLGVIGCCVGAVISSLILGETVSSILWECWCISAVGLCMYFGWIYFSVTHRIHFKKNNHYLRYIISAAMGSFLCLKPEYMLSYLLVGMLIGLPTNILFGSILYVDPILPSWCKLKYDAEFELASNNESLITANDILQKAAEKNKIALKQIIETQSCIEELSMRIFKAIPDAKLKIGVIYQTAISIRLDYIGKKYNPFKIYKDDTIFDIAGSKIFKHRALRASFFYLKGENRIHVVI